MSLAEGPASLPYPKLPFWRTVGLSYSTYFSHFIDALRASWLWLVVVAVLTGFGSWQQWTWMATAMADLNPNQPLPQIPKSGEMGVLLNVDNILLLLAGVSIAVAWHRLMILNEPPGLSGSNVATKNLWRYIVVAIALFLTQFLPIAAMMFLTFYFLPPAPGVRTSLPPGFLPIIVMIIAAYVLCAAATIRLTLLLPARAVGNTDLTFRQTWNRTRGNIWRLIWGIAATTLPPMLIAQVGFLTLMGVPDPANFASDEFVARMTAASTVGVIYIYSSYRSGSAFSLTLTGISSWLRSSSRNKAGRHNMKGTTPSDRALFVTSLPPSARRPRRPSTAARCAWRIPSPWRSPRCRRGSGRRYPA
jgi:hypothetical protein